jgi:Flp pilus assembly protein TadG
MWHGRDDDRGAALVETAIVLNLLMLLVIGTLCFGILLGYQQKLVHATADAARVVAVTPRLEEQPAKAIAAIDRALDGTDRSCSDPALTCTVSPPAPCENDPTATCRRIRVEHDHVVDPVVSRVPLIAAILPERSAAEVVVVVEVGG